MSTNGNANGHCNGVQDVLQWKVGLIITGTKYLTAETFGFKINASATALKKKQTWILEHDSSEQVEPQQQQQQPPTYVYIKSHLNRYLSADKYGTVTCETESDERGDQNRFTVEYAKDGSGRWAFKNKLGNYLGVSDDESVRCFSKMMTDTELWVVQLASHPQVNIRNVIRKRYALLCDDEIQCKETVPWGNAGLFILHFWPKHGKYSIKTCDDKFLLRDGTLVDCEEDECKVQNDALFTMEIRSTPVSGLAFKDCNGYYLTAVGSTATMKGGKNKSVGKDELFAFECSHPQVTVTSQNNGKLISAKQGVDLSANQSEKCEKSTFQMEWDKHSRKWAFRTSADNKYWSLESFGGIQAASSSVCPKAVFDVISNDDGTVCIKASNGNCLYNKQTGSILSNMDNPDSKNFIISMVDRPFLILKCDFGFVALKSDTTQKVDVVVLKTTYEPTFIHPTGDGYYYLQGKNNKYWTLADDKKSIHASDETPKCKFLLEFHENSQLTIKVDGKYLKGEANSFMAKGEEVDASTLWEF